MMPPENGHKLMRQKTVHDHGANYREQVPPAIVSGSLAPHRQRHSPIAN
jgi:hypothetical protein